MKLIYIANARIPTEKANGYQIMKMAESFADQGLDVELVVPVKRNKIKDDPFEFYGLKENFKIRRINSFDFVGHFPRFGKLSFWLQNIFFATEILFTSFEKDSVIYTRSGSVAFIFRLKGRETFFESHRLINSPKIYSLLLGKRIKIISVTNEARRRYIKLGFPEENVITAPDAVDLAVFGQDVEKNKTRAKLKLSQNKKIIGYFGSLRTMGEDKGVLDILNAMVNLPEVMLLAVGGHSGEIEYYKNKAKEIIGLGSNRIIFSQAVPRFILSEYQKSCDLLLMPFPFTKHFAYYMSPLKMFEYMASKRPIIATDLPSVREILDESTALLVPPGNPQKLAEAIEDLLNHPEKGQKLAQNAFEKVKEYTWEKRAQKIIDFLNL